MDGMAEIFGWLVGATLSTGLACAAWAYIFKKANFGGRVLAAPLLGYITSAILSSLGASNGGPVDWGYGFQERVLPGLLVGAIYGTIVWTTNNKAKPPAGGTNQ